MNFRRKAQIIPLSIILAGVLFGGVSTAQEPNPQIWGEAVHGLQMRIYSNPVERSQSEFPKFTVELFNSGERDLLLNVGDCTSARGSIAVSLVLTDAQGNMRSLRFTRGTGIGCGNSMPATRTLLAAHNGLPSTASIHSIPVDFDLYRDRSHFDQPLFVGPGEYTLQAFFTGAELRPEDVNSGAKLRAMPVWTGTIASNKLQFKS